MARSMSVMNMLYQEWSWRLEKRYQKSAQSVAEKKERSTYVDHRVRRG